MLNDLATEPRQGSPAAAATSELGFHKRFAKKPVEFGDQQPGSAIRHTHGTPGSRYRAVQVDAFQEHDLSGP